MVSTLEEEKSTGETVVAPPVGIAFLISQVGAHAAFLFGEQLKSLGLAVHHAGILRMLGSNPGLTQQALSGLLGVFPSQLVRLIDELEHRKLLKRRKDPADRRSYRLHLTRAGEKTLAQIGALTGELEQTLFAALNDAERNVLQDLLTRMVEQQRIVTGAHPAYRQLGKR